MQDRNRAIDVLKRARDILAERLTERLLEHSDDILEDALGLSYTSEIDDTYEKLGARLAHVNQMLANLPAEAEPQSVQSTDAHFASIETGQVDPFEDPLRDEIFATETYHWHVDAAELMGAQDCLPSPSETLRLSAPEGEVTWQHFVARIHRSNYDGAAAVLSELFEVEDVEARRCVQVFCEASHHGEPQLAKAAQLRREVSRSRDRDALKLLHECFGLQGLQAVSVLQSLKARFGCEV